MAPAPTVTPHQPPEPAHPNGTSDVQVELAVTKKEAASPSLKASTSSVGRMSAGASSDHTSVHAAAGRLMVASGSAKHGAAAVPTPPAPIRKAVSLMAPFLLWPQLRFQALAPD